MIRENWRTLKVSTWLGWQIESNWTEVWLFIIYVLIKPFTGSLMLVFMYYAASNATTAIAGRQVISPEFLPYLFISNACYGLVGAVMHGMSHAVISDRETYRMLKYIYISPARLQSYLVGRGLSRVAESLMGTVLNLTLGYIFFAEVRGAIQFTNIAWGWLAVYIAIGTFMLIALGLLLSGIVMNMARHGSFLSEAISGSLYLLSGAVFPLSVLPGWLQSISLVLPTTYWLEAMRRAIIGEPSTQLRSPLADWTHGELAAMLAATTVVLLIIAVVAFRYSERRAWRLGRLEETTGS